MMTSNSSDPVSTDTGSEAASPEQNTVTEVQETVGEKINKLGKEQTKAAVSREAAAPAVPVAPTYTPNFKYKTFGKEMELDEFWRPLIKDQDSEKKVKDVFTRADAFDDLKTRHESSQGEFQQLVSEYTALDKDVKRVMKFRNDGDLDNFFMSLKIPQDQIFKWVEQKLTLQNLPPEQRQALESQAQERSQRYDLEQEKAELEQQYQTQAVQARTMQLDMTLSRPEVSSIASAIDSRVGRLGAFRDLVIEEAQKAWFIQGQDLSAEQATQLAIQKYGKLFEQGPAPQAPMQGQAPAPQVQSKPVIPAVQGRGTSPIKKAPKSIDDLRAAYKEVAAQNG
jgi:hypothetical protein